MNHTPLPWKADIHIFKDDDGISTIFIWGPDGPSFGRVAMAYSECGRDDELIGNARLIMQACNSHAELLEALEDAKKAIESLDIEALGCVPDHPDYGYGWPIRDELLSKIDKAIRKARSE